MDITEIFANQAFDEYIMGFGPLKRKPAFIEEGCTASLHYVPEKKGVSILDYGKLEFAFYAPDARCVQVDVNGPLSGEWSLYQLTDGYWKGIIEQLPAGLYGCIFRKDGVRTLNPLMPVVYSSFEFQNQFEMPTDASLFALLRDVPHGSLRRELFSSRYTGKATSCWVYTPPGYDATKCHYPVLYLQHGGGENETAWLCQGKVQYIADNLFATGQASEMILVMNNGYVFTDAAEEDPAYGSIDDLIAYDCVPFIDARFRTIPSRHARAIAGVSMGAFQSNAAAMKHPDVFANVGVFSGVFSTMGAGYDQRDLFSSPDAFAATFDHFMIAYGEQEQPACDQSRALCHAYHQKGIDMSFLSCTGGHTWYVWRYAVHEFMKRLFR